jgi:hypothetical protein
MRAPILAVLALACALAGALPLEDWFSNDVVAELQSSGSVKRTFHGSDPLVLFPRLAGSDSVRGRVAELSPTAGVEMLTWFRPAAGPTGGDPTTIYNTLQAISTLKGIEYFSVSRGRTHTLFSDATFVETQGAAARLPDPVRASPPADGLVERLRAAFDDASFGRYTVDVTYETRGGAIVLTIENASVIRKLLIPVVQPGRLRSSVIVIPAGDRIVVYGLSCVHAADVFGLAERLGDESFANRLAALLSWFHASYEAAWSRAAGR